MFVCLCNPFSDSKVKECLSQMDGKPTRVKDVYKQCSGGESPNCGTCIPTLTDMVAAHNNACAVQQISAMLPTPAKSPAEPVS